MVHRGIRIAVLALAAVALMTSSPAQASAKKLPDLVIAGAALKGHPYAFQGEHNQLILHEITRNRGTALAGPSITEAVMHAQTLQTFDLTRQAVGRLGPAKQSAADSWRPANDWTYPIGQYLIEICADANDQVKESNEQNNCILLRDRVLDPVHVYVIKRAWEGTLGGFAQTGGELETYHSASARVVFDRPQNPAEGSFEYDFTGPVKYRDSEGGGGCSYSGGDTQTFGPRGATAHDTLVIDYQDRTYAGYASVDGSFYSVHVQCSGSSFTEPGPFAATFFNVDDTDGHPSKFPFGATEISGSRANAGGTQSWTWDLH